MTKASRCTSRLSSNTFLTFSIEGYEQVVVDKPSVEVTDEEYAHELTQLRESRAIVEPVEEDRAIVDGDWAEISYTRQGERRRRSCSDQRRGLPGRGWRQGYG